MGCFRAGTALYYKLSLYCYPIDTPVLTNLEATVCRLAMTKHGTLIMALRYLSPTLQQQFKETTVRESPKPSSLHIGTTASTLGEDINTIMSILQVTKSAEVGELASKFRKAKQGIDRLRIILENQEFINKLENM
ncbi:hypothetical protein EVAR_95663_1 [Eumeta japonica]|uniref:Uncharacterized protein n=1 Tax=Eumeta variegata TaxID=151549 RepID=A0A4C1VM21_EUMVA|nr:hypothetical protein EVAR_95663_1 [Eumeta japonica]